MKRIIRIIGMTVLPALLLAGCDVRKDLIDIQNDIDFLRGQIEQMNGSIASLRALLDEVKAGGIISSVVYQTEGKDTLGYVLSFQDGRQVAIREGKDGYSPQLGVQQDEDGTWCWTLDGAWLTDGDGHRIPAAARNGVDGVDGLTPQLKIIDDYWYLSVDEGLNWTQLGKAKGDDAPSVFKAVDTSAEDHVTLTLMDDSVIEIPVYRPVGLTLDIEDAEHPLAPGETFVIGYEVTGTLTDNTVVMAGTDGKFLLTMDRKPASGTVTVECPEAFSEGFVFLMVNDGEGHSAVKVVNFFGRRIEVADGWDFQIDCKGEMLHLPLAYNFDYTLEPDDQTASWVHVEQARAAMQEGEILLLADPNLTASERVGLIKVCPADNPAFVFETIRIVQSGSEFSLETESLKAEADGGAFEIRVRSSFLPECVLPESAGWLEAELVPDTDDGTLWLLRLTVAPNDGSEARTAVISVVSPENDGFEMGTLSVEQAAAVPEDDDPEDGGGL